jgi:hypothetical protein
MKHFVPNTHGLKVKTPDGYKSFAGVAFMGDEKILRIEMEDSSYLECTETHKVYTANRSVITACNLTIGIELWCDGQVKKVKEIIDTNKVEPVFDLIEVEGGHRYFTNGILSSNCAFAGEESTLISSLTLQRLKGVDPIYKTHGDVRWYDKVTSDRTYLVSLDPSAGVGKDGACIQVWSLPDMVQVAEWNSNKISIPNQVRTMQGIINGIYQDIKKAGYKGEPEIYYTLENNSWGEAALLTVNEIGEENFMGQFLHEPRRPGTVRLRKGLNTNGRTKASACTKLKSLVESNKLTVNSKLLVKQLKFFVSKGDSFAAKPGENDDCVMSTMLCIRMMQMVTNWDDKVGEMMKDVFDGDDMHESRDPMPFSVMIS